MGIRPTTAGPTGHRPAPRALRRASRTHWPAWRVALYVTLEVVVSALLVGGLAWLLHRS